MNIQRCFFNKRLTEIRYTLNNLTQTDEIMSIKAKCIEISIDNLKKDIAEMIVLKKRRMYKFDLNQVEILSKRVHLAYDKIVSLN